jgi:hypothetical protein
MPIVRLPRHGAHDVTPAAPNAPRSEGLESVLTQDADIERWPESCREPTGTGGRAREGWAMGARRVTDGYPTVQSGPEQWVKGQATCAPDVLSPAVTSHARALRGIMLGGWLSPAPTRAAPRVARDYARGLAVTRPDTRRAARCAGWCSGVAAHPTCHAPRRALRGMVLGGWRSPALTRATPRVARDGARGLPLTRPDTRRAARCAGWCSGVGVHPPDARRPLPANPRAVLCFYGPSALM